MEVNNFISKKRLFFFLFMLFAFAAMLITRYAKYMLFTGSEQKTISILRERGIIYDRNGTILAAPTTLYNVAANKNLIKDAQMLSSILAPVMDMSESVLFDKIENSDAHFLYLKKKVSESEKDLINEHIQNYDLKGIRFEAISNRIYPENNLASTLIGFLGDDGKGLTGMEYSMQNILSPPDTAKGVDGSGYSVFLTIDSTIQYMIQKIAEKTKHATQAEAIIFLAADAATGEILAYVTEPSADLAQFSRSSADERYDRPAYFMYEPGSVFKIFSMASFLDIGTVKDADSCRCDGKFEFAMNPFEGKKEKNVIRCLRPHGVVTARDIIRFSCNDGMAQIADKTDTGLFADKLSLFGFGKKTGVELPGEAEGLFAPVREWSGRTKHTIAIGQEIGVTSLQIMQAATVFTNAGKPLKLTLLSKIENADGKIVYLHKKKSLPQVVSKKTAEQILQYMQTSANEGTGFRASINGVPIAVKTGTAQMALKTGKGYSSTDYLSSCIGIFPVDNPKIILYTAIIRPVGETYGSIVAAPAISEAANAIIDYRGMGRTNAPNVSHTGIIPLHTKMPIAIGVRMPDLSGTPKRLLTDLFSRSDIQVVMRGNGYVVRQNPKPGTAITKGMIIELVFE